MMLTPAADDQGGPLCTLSPGDFSRFQELVLRQCGISLRESKERLVTDCVASRLRALGVTSPDDYLQLLEGDAGGPELVRFLDAICTNVTSFFREEAHFRFIGLAFEAWLSGGQSRFRFWSAACSTGEEAISLAIVLREILHQRQADLHILASDISASALRIARTGRYRADRLISLPEHYRQRWFQPDPDQPGDFRVAPELHRLVVWRRLNLAAPPFSISHPLDVVLCRNVMIYFDREVRRRLVEELHRVLRPGGYLVIGEVETLTGLSSGFQFIRPSIYQKL